ncbi:hypothetical protein SAMN04487944_101192 [Gracilibacillus ureilyticus]|uniref:Uncharacterized protein n=1 Tax=Gracilibacillus ureilyticus TaxID=531814 RepID=A0A1H9LCB2_9BACI|nr:hypothetical protein [Gracilibacillus ureilyticus]SER09010.1 hypothetical protein SAMN04487944_101192 [Gracilibacillus ureilyticus]
MNTEGMVQMTQKQKLFYLLKNIHTKQLQLLDYLLQSEEDVWTFNNEFLHHTKNVVSDIYQFRYYKRTHFEISLEEFLSSYRLDKKTALEILFYHPITGHDLRSCDESGKSPEELYNLSIKNPMHTMIGLVKDWDILESEINIKTKLESYL